MWDRLRFWTKTTAMLAIASTVYSVAPPANTGETAFAVKALLISRFGTPAQAEALSDEAARRMAVEARDLDGYEVRRAFRQAVDAQQRLARIDPRMADYAIRLATDERENRRAEVAENSPQFASVGEHRQ
jgi:hypothetical protein